MLDLSLYDNIFVYTTIDAAIQELDLLFNTDYAEMIGEPRYGTNFEQFLWNLTSEESTIQEYVTNKISTCPYIQECSPTVRVYYIDDDVNTDEPYYKICITLTDPNTGEEYNKNYNLKNA